jgi:hypothetical protein
VPCTWPASAACCRTRAAALIPATVHGLQCYGNGNLLEIVDSLDTFFSRNREGEDYVLVVRAELGDSVPAIFRLLEIQDSMALHQVHQVL